MASSRSSSEGSVLGRTGRLGRPATSTSFQVATTRTELPGLDWSSRHFDDGGVHDGNDEGAAAGGVAVSRSDSVARATDDRVASGSGGVLGRDRQGREDRRRCEGSGGVITGRVSVVPPRWWGESLSALDRVGPLPVVRRTRGHALFKAQGAGVREIARRLKRSPSTISRELRRNASTRTFRLEYKASLAQWHAERRARRSKTAKLVENKALHDYVRDRLSGRIYAADGRVLGPEGPRWQGKNKPHRGDRRWVQGWSPRADRATAEDRLPA